MRSGIVKRGENNMSSTMELKATHSRESEIDRRIDDLIRTLVTGEHELSREDQALLTSLMAQRSRLMRPPVPKHKARHFASKYAA